MNYWSMHLPDAVAVPGEGPLLTQLDSGPSIGTEIPPTQRTQSSQLKLAMQCPDGSSRHAARASKPKACLKLKHVAYAAQDPWGSALAPHLQSTHSEVAYTAHTLRAICAVV